MTNKKYDLEEEDKEEDEEDDEESKERRKLRIKNKEKFKKHYNTGSFKRLKNIGNIRPRKKDWKELIEDEDD
jgi:hypothetical protein